MGAPKDDAGNQEEWWAESASRAKGETSLLKYGAEDEMSSRHTLHGPSSADGDGPEPASQAQRNQEDATRLAGTSRLGQHSDSSPNTCICLQLPYTHTGERVGYDAYNAYSGVHSGVYY